MASQKDIRNAIMDVLKERIDKNNYGLMSNYKAKSQSHRLLFAEHISINGNSVSQNGTEIYHINRKYSTRKRNGMYKELTPSLEAVKEQEREISRNTPKYILGVDLDGTAGVFRIVPLDRLYEKRYFAEIEPHENLCKAINNIARSARDEGGDIDVVVVSSYLTDSDYALAEKHEWCDIQLPEVDAERRIFIPNGENKADYIDRYIEERYGTFPKENFTMLDDYTQVLTDVRNAGYHAVKFMNEINGTHGTWTGESIRFDRVDLEEQLKAIVKNEIQLRDERFEAEIAENATAELEPNIIIQNFTNDYHSGEVFAQFVAFADYGEAKEREVVGTLDYSVMGDRPAVRMIEVEDDFRRKGIGRSLMQNLQMEYPNAEIDFGYTTPQGSLFVESITYTVPDEQASPLLLKYEQLQQQLVHIENGLREIYSLEEEAERRELTLDEQKIIAGYEQLGDEWDKVHDELRQMKSEVGNLKHSHTFVYVDEEEKNRNMERFKASHGEKGDRKVAELESVYSEIVKNRGMVTDRIAVLQPLNDEEIDGVRSAFDIDTLEKAEKVTSKPYEIVYVANLAEYQTNPNATDREVAEEIYAKLNSSLHPNDYYGMSPSVGTVMVVNGKSYLTESFGFEQLSDDWLADYRLQNIKAGLSTREELRELEKIDISSLNQQERETLEKRLEELRGFNHIYEFADRRAEYRIQTAIEGHEEAVRNMKSLGYEFVWVDGFSDDGFVSFQDIEKQSESFGYDGWDGVNDFVEDVYRVVDNFTLDDINSRLQGNYDVIEYGIFDNKVIETAVKNYDQLLTARDISLFYDKTDEAVTPSWINVYVELAERGEEARREYANDIEDYLKAHEGEIPQDVEKWGKLIIDDLRGVRPEEIEKNTERDSIQMARIEDIAKRLNDFMSEYDPYNYADYGDMYDSEEQAIESIKEDLKKGDIDLYLDNLYEIREDMGEDFAEAYGEEMSENFERLISDLENLEIDFEREQRDIEVLPEDRAFVLLEEQSNLSAEQLRAELEARTYNRTDNENPMPTRSSLSDYSDEVLRRAIDIRAEQEAVSHREEKNYQLFYSYEREQAVAFARENGYHMVWGSENQGLNGDSYVVYRNAGDLPSYLVEYAKQQESVGMDLPYSNQEQLTAIYQYEMVEGISFDDPNRFTRVAFPSANERYIATTIPLSETEVAKKFKEIVAEKSVDEISALYADNVSNHLKAQVQENIKNLVGTLEAEASYPMIRSNSPWGAGVAVLTDPNEPQNYIEISVMGYESRDSIVVDAKLIKDGNKVMAVAESAEMAFSEISKMQDLSNGFTQKLDPTFRDKVVEMAREMTLDYSMELHYISNEHEREALSKHLKEVEQRGYDVENMDYSHLNTVIDGHNCFRVDSWENGTASFVLGRDTDSTDGQWYYVSVKEMDEKVSGTYTYEFDNLPNRGEVEDRHLDHISTIALDRYEEEFGADGSRNFPHLNDEAVAYTPVPNRYYEPEFEIDGTAEELFIHARNGYIDNPDALHRISEILAVEGMNEESEKVGYMEERERGNGDAPYSVAQMKLDMMDGYGDFEYSGVADSTNLTVFYEPSNKTVAIGLSRRDIDGNDDVMYEASSSISFDEFKNLSQADFEKLVNEISYYGMVEVDRFERGERENQLFPQLEYVTVADTETGWNTLNDTRNYGYVDGLVRGFNIEFKHKETGEITYNSANYVEGNIEDYYKQRIADWGDLGYNPFEAETANGFEPTGRAVFRGYGVLAYDAEERDTYVEDIDIEKYLEEHGMQLKPAEEIDPHKSIMENITNGEKTREQSLVPIEEVITAGGRSFSGANNGREAVYHAVKAFEEKNKGLIDTPVIDEDGSYEDKEFLYGAYDKYVAMSNEEQLKPYEERLNDTTDKRTIAQIHYALENGLSDDKIDVLIESANAVEDGLASYRLNELRLLLEDGLSTENAKQLIGKNSFALQALRGVEILTASYSDKQRNILFGAEEQGGVYNASWLMRDARNDGNSVKYDEHAEALIESVNQVYSEHIKAVENNVKGISTTDVYYASEQLYALITDEEIKATADEVRAVGKEMVQQQKGLSWDEAVKVITAEREKEAEKAMVSHRENSNSIGIGTMPNHDAEDKRRALLGEIKDGVRNMMTDEKFKAYLDTRSHLFYRNFSVNNTVSIFLRKPNASYVMGYDQWQAVGRTPLPKTGIPIVVPMFYYEKYSGGLYKSIRAELTAQLEKNPDKTAVYRVGKSGMELTMIKNSHSMGVRMNGREVGILDTEKKQREFIDSNILNKMVAGFNINYVFDVSDTVVKDKLWVRQSEAKKSELVLDKNGEPIKGTGAYKGKVQIYNTPERQAKFQPNLDMSVVEKDPAKMRVLFEAVVSISERHGVPVTIVDRESDETLAGGADGYFKRPNPNNEKEFAEYPRGYIVMPRDIYEKEPTRAVANLLHEVAHSDLHGNLEKLAKSMGEEKITRDMREVQAEATAYLTAKQYGLDTSTASFAYLANWAKGFDLQTFEKSLDVINIEATKLVSEISAELESRGLTHDLQDKPKEPLSEEQSRAMVGTYIQRALEAQSVIDNQLATIPALIKENEGNTDLLDIIYQQKKNLDLQSVEVETQIRLSGLLEVSGNDRATQEQLISELDASFKRSENLRLNFAEKNDTFAKIQQRDKVGLKEQFIANPQKTINSMQKEYPQLKKLSEVQRGYIAKSEYIRENLAKLLNTDPQKFVEEATKRANDVQKVMAKNGSFVECTYCEQWENGKVLSGGEIMHPKVADKILKEAESQLVGLKAQAESKGEYIPYLKCGVTVFTVTEKAKNLTAYACRVDLGDGQQKGLADYLHQVASAKTEMVQHFDEATREKNAKNKIVGLEVPVVAEMQDISHGENEATEKAEGESLENWKEDIENERKTDNSKQSQETHSNEKSRPSKNDRAD